LKDGLANIYWDRRCHNKEFN